MISQTRRPTRREFLGAAGALALGGLASGVALADPMMVDEAIAKLVSTPPIEGGQIKLDLPQIAENGNTVPLKFEVDSPMTPDNYVKSVHVFADANPRPDVASFHFTPASGKAAASIRMRLAKTQNVVAVAEMSDGKVYMAKKQVKVTIGGCGG